MMHSVSTKINYKDPEINKLRVLIDAIVSEHLPSSIKPDRDLKQTLSKMN